jgi:hypothetical protein
VATLATPHNIKNLGHVAEWLRNGLQNRVPRFNSGRGLHKIKDLAESRSCQKMAVSVSSVVRLASGSTAHRHPYKSAGRQQAESVSQYATISSRPIFPPACINQTMIK